MARNARINLFTVIFIFFMLTSGAPCAFSNMCVISMYPGHSDNICALGGGDMLIALSENDDDDLLPELPRVSLRDGPEKLLALRPDVLVTRSFAEKINPNLYKVLRQAGVKVISIDPPNWSGFRDYLIMLADSLGLNPESAIKKLDGIEKSYSEKKAQKKGGSKAPLVFLEATSRELHTCSPQSWAAHLIQLAGGVNVAQDAKPIRQGSSIASWGRERILKSLSEGLDVYIIQTGAMNGSHKVPTFIEKANANLKIVEIPERFLSRPSLFGLEKGLRELERVFWE